MSSEDRQLLPCAALDPMISFQADFSQNHLVRRDLLFSLIDDGHPARTSYAHSHTHPAHTNSTDSQAGHNDSEDVNSK